MIIAIYIGSFVLLVIVEVILSKLVDELVEMYPLRDCYGSW